VDIKKKYVGTHLTSTYTNMRTSTRRIYLSSGQNTREVLFVLY